MATKCEVKRIISISIDTVDIIYGGCVCGCGWMGGCVGEWVGG